MARAIPIIAWCYGLSSLTPIAYYYASMAEFRRDNPYGCFGDKWRFIKNPTEEQKQAAITEHKLIKNYKPI